MAFEGLSSRLQEITRKLRGKARINESDLKEMLREVKLALLEADVNYKIVKEFINTIQEKALGQDVLKSLTPGQQVVKIVKDELVELLGGTESKINFTPNPPTVIMLVGLQGSGKTTTAGKLANLLRKQGKKPLLVACDVYRPAAQTRDKSAVNEEQMKELTEKLKEEFDYIIIDCPAGIEQGFKNAIAGANRAIVVTTAEISAIRDADRIVGLLEASEIKNPELVVNRLRPAMVRKGEMMDVEDIVDLLSIDLIGVVPDDEYIITQTNKGEPVVSNHKAPSGKAYIEIARRILGENIEVTIPGRKESFFAKLKHRFSKK